MPKLLGKEFTKPVKTELTEKKTMKLMANPQSEMGKKILREKFNLPPPIQKRIRSCGQKLDAGKRPFPAKSILLIIKQNLSYKASKNLNEGSTT